LDATFGVSHRTVGTAEFGKVRVAFHSELQAGGAVLGNFNIGSQDPEKHNNENKTMKNTKQTKKNVKNMREHKKSITTRWWLVLLLVAPLV
jgi:hypothetical protein